MISLNVFQNFLLFKEINMPKVAVVIRQLSGSIPVVSCVIGESKNHTVEEQDIYLHRRAEEHIAEFKKKNSL
jgi:hypothetical protein